MSYNKSTTIGELSSLSSKVFKENDVFKMGKRRLAQIFLRELLELNSGASEKELESAYKKVSATRKGIPADSEAFWSFVETKYLRLNEEPNTKFAELSFLVNEDLVALSENLSYIKKEQALLEEKKRSDGRLSADDRYYRNQLEYFEKKNLVAKDEIIDFMTHRIKSYAIAMASVNPVGIAIFGSSFFGNRPYAFGRRYYWTLADPYDVRSLDVYSNKFMDLSVPVYQEFVKGYKSSPEKFKEFATAYINGVPDAFPSVREKLSDLVDKSHILFSRKQVIETMLRHFEERDYISFVSMAPLQIEGIFADICRGIGVSESQLDISSLNDKLQYIDEKIRRFLFFEYYSFKFPVLRNLVAHGGLVDGELEDTAILLMLDLLPVCELTVSKELPIMHALEVLKGAGSGNNKKLVEWLDLRRSVIIPDFYGVKKKIVEVEALYASQGFWNYLEGELKKLKDENQVKSSEPVKVAGKLKSYGIAIDQAEKFLKSSARVAAEAIKKRNEILERFSKILKPEMPSPKDAL